MRITGTVTALLFAAIVIGCRNDADVSISGNVNGLQEGDSVFVTLSRDWEDGGVPPISFTMDAEGRFALRFSISGRPQPITFVKNGELLASLEWKDASGYAPVLVERVSGKEFPVSVVSEQFLKARIQIP
ncbi:MAG: hypothetical protein GF331_02350 [Chitinivibrionales bacterium]|nr:hypothetical protein [Chitinivibrionales bacterium]